MFNIFDYFIVPSSELVALVVIILHTIILLKSVLHNFAFEFLKKIVDADGVNKKKGKCFLFKSHCVQFTFIFYYITNFSI